MNVSVREFKDRLSKYLRLVGEGKPVVITSHNKPVAILNPVARTDKPSLQQLLKESGLDLFTIGMVVILWFSGPVCCTDPQS